MARIPPGEARRKVRRRRDQPPASRKGKGQPRQVMGGDVSLILRVMMSLGLMVDDVSLILTSNTWGGHCQCSQFGHAVNSWGNPAGPSHGAGEDLPKGDLHLGGKYGQVI